MKNLKRLFYIGLLLLAATAAFSVPLPRSTLPARSGPSIADARAWGYQLQRAAPNRMASAIDLLVIDYARGSTPRETLPATEVQRFRTRPDGSPRIVLAYLSIGEAENYRYYWWPRWRTAPPTWLAAENPEWKGNFRIRFWEGGWRRIIMNPRPTLADYAVEQLVDWHKPYLDRIIEAGFDGVYLDRVDAYEEWKTVRPTAEAEMIDLVTDLASYARSRRPGFLVVTQNGEELLSQQNLRATIDAAAKEDLWFGVEGPEAPNNARTVSRSLQLLNRMRADNKPVFVVEYLTDAQKRQSVRRTAIERGFIATFAPRQLDHPPELDEPSQPSRPPDTAPPAASPPSKAMMPSRPIAPQPARPKQQD